MLKEKWMQPNVGSRLMGMIKTNFTEKYKKFFSMKHKSLGSRLYLETQRNDGFGFVTNY